MNKFDSFSNEYLISAEEISEETTIALASDSVFVGDKGLIYLHSTSMVQNNFW